MKTLDDKYDVIIIGAGIGGLVCGNYLAKAGMKVLIVEKNNKPGGYCSSFRVGKFGFDMSTLQGCHEQNEFGKIIRELEINKKIEINRVNPSYVITTPDYKITIKNDINETVTDLQKYFPHQTRQIKDFFEFTKTANFNFLYLRWKNKTFKDLVSLYFSDNKLKAIFMIMLGQSGISPLKISGLTAISYFRNLFLDGGYYVKGGMQVLADAFAENFQRLGGELLLSCIVKKIKVKDKKVEGVIFQKKNFISAKYIISNCDASQTFLTLVGEGSLEKKFINRLKKMLPSISAFIVYLGINKTLKAEIDYCQELWYCPRYDLEDPWDISRLEKKCFDGHIYCYFYSFQNPTFAPLNSESISVGILAPYLNKKYWSENKFDLAEKVIKRAEKVIPNLSTYIVKKIIITPQTLYKYTLNQKGAMRGWAPIPSQIDKTIMPQRTLIEGLFLAGHWVTLPFGESGLPMAAYSGRTAAKLVLKSIKNLPGEKKIL